MRTTWEHAKLEILKFIKIRITLPGYRCDGDDDLLSQNTKCICLKLPNVFFSNCKIYLYYMAKCIRPKLQNIFFSNCKMYFPQILKFNCFKLQNVFVLNCKIYLSQIEKKIL